MSAGNFGLLNTLKLIQRWPYLFFIPLIILLLTLLTYTSGSEKYRASAIVLFQSGYIPVEEYFTLLDKFDDRPMNIVRSLLYGDSANEIVSEAWPAIKNDETARINKIDHLRSLSGVSLKFQRDNPQALNISYSSEDPKLAYNVVNATIKSLVKANQAVTETKINSAVKFLEAELEKSRKELSEIEQKIIRLRAGLPKNYLQNIDDKSQSLEKALDIPQVDYDIEKNLADSFSLDQSPQELEFALEIAKKELVQLENDLSSKSYLSNINNLELALNAGNDTEVSRTNSIILEKQQKLNELLSKGFLDAHPDVSSIKREIDNLQSMKQSRLIELQKQSVQESPELTNLRLEKLQLKKIEDKKIEIRLYEDRLNAAKASAINNTKPPTLDDKLRVLSDRKSELLELENNKLVISHSYAQMAKRLEVLKREGRVDQDKFGLSIKVAEQPKIPQTPQPFATLPIVLAGLVIGCTILFTLAAIMSYFDKSIYDSQQLLQLTSLPVIGTVDGFMSRTEINRRKLTFKIVAAGIILYTVGCYLFFRL